MRDTRVVITGVGAFSACGAGADTLWQAARDGVSGMRPVSFDRLPDQKVMNAAPISDEMLQQHGVHMRPRMQDRVSQFALIAAEEAILQSGLKDSGLGDDVGVIVGSGFGGARALDDGYHSHYGAGSARMDPLSIPKIMTNAAASWISMTYGATGPIYCNSTACSSASQSIGMAYQMVKAGMMRACITGGTEA